MTRNVTNAIGFISLLTGSFNGACLQVVCISGVCLSGAKFAHPIYTFFSAISNSISQMLEKCLKMEVGNCFLSYRE